MEIWKDIPNYEGKYQVNNFGAVKSLARKKFNGYAMIDVSEKILTLNNHRDGYLWINLSANNKRKHFFIHRLVMLAFIGESKLQVDHINGNKKDNNLSNLQYVTNRENCTLYQISKGNFKGYSYDKKRNKYVSQIYHNKKHIFLGYYDNSELAQQAYLKYLTTIQ
jgi:hypothetical protein